MGKKLGAFLAGGVIGAAVALLYAPRTGRETRALVTERMNSAWGEAQEFGTHAAGNVQQTYRDVAVKSQQFAQDAQMRGQELYGQASARVQDAAANFKPAFVQKNDELRDKIEAARQRIAAQVAKNAEDAQADVESTVTVEPCAVQDAPTEEAAQPAAEEAAVSDEAPVSDEASTN